MRYAQNAIIRKRTQPIPSYTVGKGVIKVSMVGRIEKRMVKSTLQNRIIEFYKYTDGWFGSRVVSVLVSGAEGPGFKSQPRF